jgi:dTDP-4-dehydrorhamnose 3,5-epimerase
MTYTAQTTDLPDVLLLTPKVFGDERGFFYESFNQRAFEEATGQQVTFVQDNHSRSTKNVLRGLHFQTQHPQGKLVRVCAGEVFDVAVDVRVGSPSFGKWTGHYLSAKNNHQLWVPPGFAHGFMVLSESAEFLYKTTDYYFPAFEQSLFWAAPAIGIQWPKDSDSVEPILAGKDQANRALSLKQVQELLMA